MMSISDLPQPGGGFAWRHAASGAVLVHEALDRLAGHFFTMSNLELRGNEAEWSAVAQAADVPRDRLRLLRQVHGAGVAVVRRGDPSSWTPPEADAIVTDDQTVALAVRVADCAPILIADGRRRAVAAVHAGWRGTMKGVAGAAVEALGREFGCDPGDLVAAIGPCLGPCCGEMGLEVAEMFRAAGHDEDSIGRWFTAGTGTARPHFDLWRANRDQLERAGVAADRVFAAALCTKSHPSVFHSYRAHGAGTGRLLGLIKAR
jgi:polyphenol oxidase